MLDPQSRARPIPSAIVARLPGPVYWSGRQETRGGGEELLTCRDAVAAPVADAPGSYYSGARTWLMLSGITLAGPNRLAR